MFVKQMDRAKKVSLIVLGLLLAGWLIYRSSLYPEQGEPGLVGPTMCVCAAVMVLITVFTMSFRERENQFSDAI